jgi:prepilin signal peptidase PulO-like enzyme (type II secretory pathway)
LLFDLHTLRHTKKVMRFVTLVGALVVLVYGLDFAYIFGLSNLAFVIATASSLVVTTVYMACAFRWEKEKDLEASLPADRYGEEIFINSRGRQRVSRKPHRPFLSVVVIFGFIAAALGAAIVVSDLIAMRGL